MKHTLAILVKNLPGVLKTVIGIFDAKGYNIDSLTVGVTNDPATSRITVVADTENIGEVMQYLSGCDAVLKVKQLTDGTFLRRSHVLIKVRADNKARGQVVQIADIFRAKIVDVSTDTATLEITGDDAKIDALMQMLADFGILETVRAGSLAIERGELLL